MASYIFRLPIEYKFLEVLGTGSYGEVVKCWKKDTKQTVAVKLPKFQREEDKEVKTMEKLMHLQMDKQNIIKFFGSFDTRCGRAMVFESLDISLYDYLLKNECAPMLLRDIRSIIQQLATAFHALRSINMIHADLKLDNIMLVDHRKRPLKVKLIDFGLAMHRSKAKQGSRIQIPNYRAPEVSLGLPLSEAIDVWALGCVMSVMIFGNEVISGNNSYEALQDMIAFLGMPADHLLNDGRRTECYFTKTECNSWRLKTHEEYWVKKSQKRYQTSVYYNLNDLRELRLEKKNKSEAVERKQCIDLLEAMLEMDGTKRITPLEILSHPFITGGPASSRIKKKKKRSRLAKKKGNAHQGLDPDSTEAAPGVIMVHPAAAMNQFGLKSSEEISDQHLTATPSGVIMVSPAATVSLLQLESDEMSEGSPADAGLRGNNRSDQHLTATPSGVIMVSPAATVNLLQLESDEMSVESPTNAALQTEPSPAAPSGGIMVSPAENTLQTKDLENTDSVQAELVVTAGDSTSVTAGGSRIKKKKKNFPRRLLSWMKKTFCSCCAAAEQDEEGDE